MSSNPFPVVTLMGYEFVSLSPEQVEARRKHLDRTGLQAHFLPVVLLIFIYVYREISPRFLPKSHSVSGDQPTGFGLFVHRLKWVASNTYIAEFGQFHVQIFGLLYTAALLYLIFKDTGNDYMHVTKAFGHVAVSQLPYQYWFALKHPKSPVTQATGLTHERLNAYHRLFGRITQALLVTHAVLYLRFFVAIDALPKRLGDWDVRFGLMALWALNILGILSIAPIRKRVYFKVFYKSHVILSIILPVIIILHVPYTRKYMAEAIFLWITNGVFRQEPLAETASVTSKKVGGKLLQVVAELKKGESWRDWVPGMHGYLVHGTMGPRSPFTIVDVKKKGEGKEVGLIVRDLGGPMTGMLGEAAVKGETLKLDLEGPYGEAMEYMPSHLKEKNLPVLIVAGGVGATYALPIYTALAETREDLSQLKFIWVVKSPEDADWGMKTLETLGENNVQIHVTGNQSNRKPATNSNLPGVEISLHSRRPNFAEIIDSFVATAVSERNDGKSSSGKTGGDMSVMVCGPGSLSQSLRRALSKHAWEGRRINWYEEQFGFGGS